MTAQKLERALAELVELVRVEDMAIMRLRAARELREGVAEAELALHRACNRTATFILAHPEADVLEAYDLADAAAEAILDPYSGRRFDPVIAAVAKAEPAIEDVLRVVGRRVRVNLDPCTCSSGRTAKSCPEHGAGS